MPALRMQSIGHATERDTAYYALPSPLVYKIICPGAGVPVRLGRETRDELELRSISPAGSWHVPTAAPPHFSRRHGSLPLYP